MGGDLVNFWLMGGVPPQLGYNEKPCSPAIFKANQIAWFFCTKFLQKGFTFRIHFNFWGESGIVGKGVAIRIVRLLVQTPPGARPYLGTQPSYEASGDLQVKIEKNEWLTSGYWGCSLENVVWGLKLAMEQANRS